MGCASSAALPFLSGSNPQALSDTPQTNGQPSYPLRFKKSDALQDVKAMDEGFVSQKVKEVVDSSAVQGIIGNVVLAKDEVVHQVQGAGQSIAHKVSSVMEDVEDKIESVVGHIGHEKDKIEDLEKSVEEKVKDRENDIDELLAAIPGEEEVKEVKDKAETKMKEMSEDLKEAIKGDSE